MLLEWLMLTTCFGQSLFIESVAKKTGFQSSDTYPLKNKYFHKIRFHTLTNLCIIRILDIAYLHNIMCVCIYKDSLEVAS